MSELDIIEPAATVVTFRGERLEIRPLTIGQFPRFVQIIRPIVEQLEAPESAGLKTGSDVDLLLNVIERHVGPVVEAVALASGRPSEWIEGADTCEFLELALAIMQRNSDFFAQRLHPLLADLRKRASGSGPTASATSSSTVIH